MAEQQGERLGFEDDLADGAPTRRLNYAGNSVRDKVGQIVGPDLFGGMWVIVHAEYDEAHDVTRCQVMPHVLDPAVKA